jgi:multidrug efflux pump subunit AcrA (membrane-fusion protein)
VALPAQHAITRYLDATGNTAPVKTVDLVARVQGFLQSIDYQDGTLVKEGTTLFTIEPETYKLKLEQAQAAEAGVQASLKQTEADYNWPGNMKAGWRRSRSSWRCCSRCWDRWRC